MFIIGIDPGLTTGYAIINNDRLINYGKLSFHENNYSGYRYNELMSYYIEGDKYVFIETQYNRFARIKVVNEIAGYMLYTAKDNGFHTIQVYPRQWQALIKDLPFKTAKERSIIHAKKIFKLDEDLDDNVTDAINIAYYANRSLKEYYKNE